MKRSISLLLIILLCISLLTACKDEDVIELDDDIEQQIMDIIDDIGSDVLEDTEEEENEKNSFNTSIEEQVILDDKGIKITAFEIEQTDSVYNNADRFDISVMVENNTDDDKSISVQNTTVNGYLVSETATFYVDAGKKRNDKITIYIFDYLEMSDIGEIMFDFRVRGSDYSDTYETDVITIKTSAYDQYDYNPNFAGDVLYDKDGTKVTYVESEIDDGDYLFYMLIENSKPEKRIIGISDEYINGFDIMTLFGVKLFADTKAYVPITIRSDKIEDNRIDKLEEFVFKIVSTDIDYNDREESEEITIKP